MLPATRSLPWALLGLALLLAATATAGQLGPYEPVTGCYIGAFVELDDNVAGEISEFERLTGKKHATYFKYVGYGQPFPYKWVKDLHSKGAVPHIAWEPNEGLGPVRDDDYLNGWAQAAARAGGPIFLRYASEMNGNWMAYSGDPDLYVEKWKLVYRIMHEYAPNVVMVWCPYATPRKTIPVYYPGDEYVDWVGVNLYSVYRTDGDPTKPPSEDPRELLRFVYDLFAYRKPIAICEYAATHYCVATKLPVVDFCLNNMTRLYQSLPTQFPRVRMINWFSVDTERNNLAHNNYSVTDNPQVLQAYAQLVSSDHFLARVPDEVMVAARPPSPIAVPTGPGEPVAPTNPTLRPPVGVTPGPTSAPLAGSRPGSVAATAVAIVVQGSAPSSLSGRVEVLADIGRELPVETVMFYLDGAFAAMTNVQPFRLTVDTANLEPGEHRIKIVASSASDRTLGTTEASIIVAPR